MDAALRLERWLLKLAMLAKGCWRIPESSYSEVKESRLLWGDQGANDSGVRSVGAPRRGEAVDAAMRALSARDMGYGGVFGTICPHVYWTPSSEFTHSDAISTVYDCENHRHLRSCSKADYELLGSCNSNA